VKARILSPKLDNQYVRGKGKKQIKSQVEIYRYLAAIKKASPAHSRFAASVQLL
jgi:hypothetical protein